MDEGMMVNFIKDMKNTTNLSDQEIANLAASQIANALPKSRM